MPRATAILVLAGCFLLLGLGFHRRGLWSGYEGRGAQYAQGMIDSGRWGLPRLFWLQPDLQKPPLYYWLVAAAALLRGGQVDEFAVRLPAVVSAMLLVLIVYALATHWWGRTAGALAAAILTTMPRFWWLARVGRLDMSLSLCVAVALACFWMALAAKRHEHARQRLVPSGWIVGAYVSLGLGVLFKGPIALALAAVAIAAFLALQSILSGHRERGMPPLVAQCYRRLLMLRPLWGVLIVSAVAGPWFIWSAVQTDGQLWSEFFVYHNWQRAFGGADALQGRPPWYYVGPLTADTFPWSLPAAVAIGAILHATLRNRPKRRDRHHARTPNTGGHPADSQTLPPQRAVAASPDPSSRNDQCPLCFCAAWTLAIFVLLSLAQFKRQDYLLPLYPGIALLVAGTFARLRNTRSASDAFRWVLAVAAAVVVITALAASGMLWYPAPNTPLNFDGISGGGMQPGRMVPALMDELQAHAVPLQLGIAATAIFAILALRRIKHNRWTAAGACLALAVALAEATLLLGVVPAMDRMRNQRPFADVLRSIVPPGETIVYHRMENHDLVFYAGAPAEVVVSTRDLRAVLENRPGVFLVLRERCKEHCEGSCIGGCLRRRREQWPDLPLTVLATNRGRGDAKESLALVTNAVRR